MSPHRADRVEHVLLDLFSRDLKESVADKDAAVEREAEAFSYEAVGDDMARFAIGKVEPFRPMRMDGRGFRKGYPPCPYPTPVLWFVAALPNGCTPAPPGSPEPEARRGCVDT